jgi:hypothetical protein
VKNPVTTVPGSDTSLTRRLLVQATPFSHRFFIAPDLEFRYIIYRRNGRTCPNLPFAWQRVLSAAGSVLSDFKTISFDKRTALLNDKTALLSDKTGLCP